MILASNDFEAAHDPQCNILCFRYVPKSSQNISTGELSILQQKIRQKLLKDGNGYITATKIEGELWLRVTILNPLTTRAHLEGLMTKIRALVN
jgi:L-2,4-diaminobutyrate decarboxylase